MDPWTSVIQTKTEGLEEKATTEGWRVVGTKFHIEK